MYLTYLGMVSAVSTLEHGMLSAASTLEHGMQSVLSTLGHGMVSAVSTLIKFWKPNITQSLFTYLVSKTLYGPCSSFGLNVLMFNYYCSKINKHIMHPHSFMSRFTLTMLARDWGDVRLNLGGLFLEY